ncbi:DUF5991 domain-containing protein [Mucilaginibacter sp. KACC 22063]|uniref:DUF5991 domain-containing protein n=1 Tax=Mucilaginibacter sp. KACC 22063 TaxID=3025666 RepID=UPI0023657B88|nr:DUF5991 domain-containing protein [Mucilaginibacter sp. KACC 22063]WDF56906.1 DUF5991 domain-containing protein [Mucilaginibacter sp. KACC 22063]
MMMEKRQLIKGLLFIVTVILCIFSFIPKSAAQQPNWAGKYEFEEATSGSSNSPGMVMEWDFTVKKVNGQFQGSLEVAGQTTNFTYKTDLKLSGNTINVYYNKQTDGPVYDEEAYKKGQLLFSLSNINGKITTHWAALKPQLNEKAPAVCKNCFVRKTK